ncbi:hypothetical protein WMY93_032601 [Mugilogobius chulae]|uniref:Uncharacterized protein n=1 Tax=Mugilogobius chulae TaxID=88201 RepID=A0AAW0MVX2_9GOBI
MTLDRRCCSFPGQIMFSSAALVRVSPSFLSRLFQTSLCPAAARSLHSAMLRQPQTFVQGRFSLRLQIRTKKSRARLEEEQRKQRNKTS